MSRLGLVYDTVSCCCDAYFVCHTQTIHDTTTILTGLRAVVGAGMAVGSLPSGCTDCTKAIVALPHTGNSGALPTAGSSMPQTVLDMLPECFPLFPVASGCAEASPVQQAAGSTLAAPSSSLSPTVVDLLPESFPLCISSWQGLVNSAQLDATLQPDTPPVAEAISYSTGCCSEGARCLQLHSSQVSGKQKQRRRRRTEPQAQAAYAESTIFFAGCSPIATVEALMSVFDQFGSVVDINLFRQVPQCSEVLVCRRLGSQFSVSRVARWRWCRASCQTAVWQQNSVIGVVAAAAAPCMWSPMSGLKAECVAAACGIAVCRPYRTCKTSKVCMCARAAASVQRSAWHSTNPLLDLQHRQGMHAPS
jgi:hypothetical protein